MAAAVSAMGIVRFGRSVELSMRPNNLQMIGGRSNMVSFGRGNIGGFPSIRTLPLQICFAKEETVKQVCEIVRKQLALAPEVQLTPESTFAELGADSLDTVEIVMGLEEAFEITVEEENSDNITTVKDAADLIDKLVEKKGAAA